MSAIDNRAASRHHWYSREKPTVPDINCGSLQRIADAVESMSVSYRDLIAERNSWERIYKHEKASREILQRRAAALQGVITKKKKEIAELRAQGELAVVAVAEPVHPWNVPAATHANHFRISSI